MEVQPRSDTAPSRWAALARCGRSGHVQAWLDGIQVSSQPSARLLVWAVHASRSSRWKTVSLFSQPQLARRPKVPAEHVWSSCLCCGCTNNLELAVGWTAKPRSPQCHLLTQLKDVSVSTIPGALNALKALCDYALYKSTFTLHYIGLASWSLCIHPQAHSLGKGDEHPASAPLSLTFTIIYHWECIRQDSAFYQCICFYLCGLFIWNLFDTSQTSKAEKSKKTDRETDMYKRNTHSVHSMLKLWKKHRAFPCNTGSDMPCTKCDFSSAWEQFWPGTHPDTTTNDL